MDSGWKMNEVLVNLIKETAKEYKTFYPYAFNLEIPKSDEFKTFIYNSRKNFVAVIEYLNIEEPESLFMKLYDNFDKRVSKNDTGCSIFRYIFYVAFTSAVINQAKKTDTREFPVTIDETETLLDFLEQARERNDWEYWGRWYRGQSNFQWDIFPSFYRNLENTKLLKIDSKKLFADYNNFGLINKASRTIGYSNVDYDFISFMQHAVSFSPLIDFTTNPLVAAVMSLSDTDNFREHYNNDSAIFELNINENRIVNDKEEIDRVIKNFVVYYTKKVPFLETITISGKDITILNMDNLVEVLTHKYLLIDIPTNDRMRYQSGKFILFYDCLILDKKVYVELAPGMKITKYRLNKKLKQKRPGKTNCLDAILKEYPEFSYTNMMDPYGWFGQ